MVTRSSAVDRFIRTVALVALPIFSVSCVTPETPQEPANFDEYALMDDDNDRTDGFELKTRSTTMIISVDRAEIRPYRKLISPEMAEKLEDTYDIDLEDAVPLSPGEHKLLVRACEQDPSLLNWRNYGGLSSGALCASTVIRFNAEPGGRYRLAGSVSRGKDHADIWVENLRDGSLAVDKIRIKGLKNEDF